MRPLSRPIRLRRTTPRVVASSPFHIALLSSKICVLSRHANLDIRITQCQLPSVVKERHSDHLFPVGTSPLPAEREFRFGAEPAKKRETIKNPATSAGRIRPSLGALLPRP